MVPAKVKNGWVVHKAINFGDYLYIVCHADPTTLKTERVEGEITCKKCLRIKNEASPNFQFADGVHALKHPFCNKETNWDGFRCGYHDGRENLKKFLNHDLTEDFIKGYEEGYIEGQQTYTYHYKNGDVKDKPVTNITLREIGKQTKNNRSGCAGLFFLSIAIPLLVYFI